MFATRDRARRHPPKLNGVSFFINRTDTTFLVAAVFFWPKENRKAEGTRKLGVLHVKCVVGDGRWLFLSSANLTKYAFSLNMELGVLITGGHAPQSVERMFERLISDGVFAAIT
jgi:phosphatidylserine/phosphatidylglycerophosphate/cardiolipin synthase-like enzyme